MMKRLVAAGFVVLALPLPASAVPYCTGSGVSFSFGFSVGRFSESEVNEFNLMQLRRMGVDATAAEKWNGCIRAFVRKPGGGEEMQFFDPNTFQRVY
ncbi:MAG: hypothetical protein KIS86_14160 [Devosia sp.]|nr:hypothetical protein [Devosia sp.]